MKLWISRYSISVGYLDGSLPGTYENKTQMGMELKQDSIDVRGLSNIIYLCIQSTCGTLVDNQYLMQVAVQPTTLLHSR